MIELSKIRLDGGTQSRASINEETVAEYAEAMADPATVFPPAVVYYDGKDHWLADGFHRVAAWARIGRTEVPCDVRQGDRRRAILHSVAANSAHGLRRTNEDKRRAVLTLLDDAEWSQWSDREIARRCGVSAPLVAAVRGSLTVNYYSEEPVTYTTKHGTTAQMNTANIGGGSNAGQKTESAQTTVAKAEIAPHPAEGNQPGGADQENTTAPDPVDPIEAKARRDLAKLTPGALIDDVIGLRALVAHERAKRREAEAKAQALKDDLSLLADASDMGSKVTRLLDSLRKADGRRKEIEARLARAERHVRALEKERDELRRRLENQIIPMDGAA
jgi:hypothetical protein